MPILLDRKRLKDRIVENVSKAVKQIQEIKYYSGEGSIQFSNDDWQLCRLVEHLDHAFLHGLRHISSGYWVVVRDFTHQSTVKDINRLQNVTTNLGRGRAWLYTALNDQLLESYLRCYLANQKIVAKYYAKEALVLDQQQMQILLTLSAGLEYVTFQLDIDMAYLDLSSHRRKSESRRSESEEEEADSDHLSLCSMDSSMSQSSSMNAETLTARLTDVAEIAEVLNEDTGDSPSPNTEVNPTKTRISRISKIPCVTSLDLDTKCGDDLEVIHVKRKVKSRKSRSNKKRADSDSASVCSYTPSPSPVTPDNGVLGTEGHSDRRTPQSDGREQQLSSTPSEANNLDLAVDHLSASYNSSGFQCDPLKLRADSTSSLDSKSRASSDLSTHTSLSAVSSVTEPSTSFPKDCGRATPEPSVTKDCSIATRVDTPEPAHPQECISHPDTSHTDTATCTEACDIQNSRKESVEFSIYDNSPVMCSGVSKPVDPIPEKPAESRWSSNIEELSKNLEQNSRISSHIVKPGLPETTSVVRQSPTDSGNGSLCNGFDNTDVGAADATVDMSEEDLKAPADYTVPRAGSADLAADKQELVHPAELRVENNLLLLIMLQVFEDEEEQFVKLFATSVGHTEGEWEPVYFLVTTTAFYILKPSCGEIKFQKLASVRFTELDYISLGLSWHTMHVVCTNRRKQFWVTTADELLTKCIIQELDHSIQNCDQGNLQLSVLTDATAQKIALKKYLDKDTKLKGKWNVPFYSLVHWEDSQARLGSLASLGVRREGVLLYKSNSYMEYVPIIGGPTWKPGYFVLRDGLLLQYSDKHRTNTVPKHAIQLFGGECCGCRRSRQSDRPNTFELMLSDGTCLEMSAATDEEVQGWLQALCQAVSEGLGVSNSTAGTLACCAVITSTEVHMCHEDTHTNFIRTLGSANIVDITSILIDQDVRNYAVLSFESTEPGVTSESWAIFFNSETERDKLVCCASQWWGSHYQVSLPVNIIEDAALQRRCRETCSKVNAISKLQMKL